MAERARPRPFYTLASYAQMRAVFGPLAVGADEMSPVSGVIRRIADWSVESASALERIPRSSAARRLLAIERVVSTGLGLMRRIDTAAIHEWMKDSRTDPAAVERFKGAKTAYSSRYDAMVRLLGEVATDADIARPSDVGNLLSFRRNFGKLAHVLGTRGSLDTLGVLAACVVVAFRERALLRSALGRILRTDPRLPFGRRNVKRAARINARVAFQAVDYTRAEDLRATFEALRSKGVRGETADAWVTKALLLSRDASGRAWKGLVRLRELIEHADLDPHRGEFEERLRASMRDAIHYTHVPGAEIVVRDYEIGSELAMLDGKVDRVTGNVAMTQGGGSVVPGMFRHSPEGLAAGRKYVEPLDMFLRSMVTADGTDHKTQKAVFNRLFGWGPVLETTPFVESTLKRLLDDAVAKASGQDGTFDFKMDFAFHFPIAVICHMLGIPQEDAPRVQRWTEHFVRALDAGTGVSPASMATGNLAAQELREYLGTMIRRARAGEEVDGIVGDLARKELPIDDTVLVSNLVVLIFAGFETTTGLLCMGVHELLQRPEQWRYLRSCLVPGAELTVDGAVVTDADLRWSNWSVAARSSLDPAGQERLGRLEEQLARSSALVLRRAAIEAQEEKLEAAVEEMLRFTAPGSVIPLALNEDYQLVLRGETSIGGCVYEPGESITLEKGQMVNIAVDELNRRCPFGAGRFDTEKTGAFDVSRTDNRHHLSFGRAHSCIGARLATENMKRALQAVLERFPDLELAGAPAPQQFDLFNGLASLPVRFRACPDRGA